MSYFTNNKIIFYSCLILLITFIILKRKKFRWKTHQQQQQNSKQESRGFYAKLINILQKQNITRESNQTPLEFMSTLSAHPAIEDIEQITDSFINVFYAGNSLTEKERKNIKIALENIAQTNIKNEN